jgi:hypothetical protein
MLHIFSSIDLSATQRTRDAEPKSGEWMDPYEAALHLVRQSFNLPGMGRSEWTGDWFRPAEPRRPSSGRTFPLGTPPQDLLDAALVDAEARLDALMGPYALGGLSESEIEFVWWPLVQAAIERQWDIRLGRVPSGLLN